MELKNIKRKIVSVNNIRELTAALETLSALKMKKSQKIALLSRPFSQKASQLLAEMETKLKEERPFFLEDKPGDILTAVVASDRGFCGTFNQNMLRFAESQIKDLKRREKVSVVTIGKRSFSYFSKKEYSVEKSFFGFGDYGEIDQIKPISDFLVNSFSGGKFSQIYLFYTDFISTFVQKPRKIKLLPFKKEDFKEFFREQTEPLRQDFLIEPSPVVLIEEIIPQLIEYLIYQCVLESNASEHSARMMAMRNASDNAEKITTDLRLEYNKARQEQITKEVSEISSAKEAIG